MDKKKHKFTQSNWIIVISLLIIALSVGWMVGYSMGAKMASDTYDRELGVNP